MTNSLRFSVAATVLAVLAACSSPSAQPAMSDDLKADLARVGASDVQLAGASTTRRDVVSAVERSDAKVAAPRAPSTTRVASTARGTRAVVRSRHREVPVPMHAEQPAEAVAPAVAPREEPAPEPVQSQERPHAPMPSTQREPAGGWKTPGQIIRNAPFPINP